MPLSAREEVLAGRRGAVLRTVVGNELEVRAQLGNCEQEMKLWLWRWRNEQWGQISKRKAQCDPSFSCVEGVRKSQ